MMLHNEKNIFTGLIGQIQSQTGLSPRIIEKDYYVTMILRGLSEARGEIVFKGGTSLSKCYGLINRFSEDIDITVDEKLGEKRRKSLKYALVEVVNGLGLEISNLQWTRSKRNVNQYFVEYKPVIANDDFVTSRIIVEVSQTVRSFPVNLYPVKNYIGTFLAESGNGDLAEKWQVEPFIMKVQSLDRTLIDKVFAICDYYLGDKASHHSRHLYDIAKLLPVVPRDDAFRALVSEVRAERAKASVCLSASPEYDISVLLTEIMDKEFFREDFQAQTLALLAPHDKTSYDDAIAALRRLNEEHLF